MAIPGLSSKPTVNNQNESFYERHKGVILGGTAVVGVAGAVLVGPEALAAYGVYEAGKDLLTLAAVGLGASSCTARWGDPDPIPEGTKPIQNAIPSGALPPPPTVATSRSGLLVSNATPKFQMALIAQSKDLTGEIITCLSNGFTDKQSPNYLAQPASQAPQALHLHDAAVDAHFVGLAQECKLSLHAGELGQIAPQLVVMQPTFKPGTNEVQVGTQQVTVSKQVIDPMTGQPVTSQDWELAAIASPPVDVPPVLLQSFSETVPFPPPPNSDWVLAEKDLFDSHAIAMTVLSGPPGQEPRKTEVLLTPASVTNTVSIKQPDGTTATQTQEYSREFPTLTFSDGNANACTMADGKSLEPYISTPQ